MSSNTSKKDWCQTGNTEPKTPTERCTVPTKMTQNPSIWCSRPNVKTPTNEIKDLFARLANKTGFRK